MRILEINKFYNAKRGADKHFLEVISLLEKNGHQVASFAMAQTDDQASKWRNYFVSTVGYTNAFSLWQKLKGSLRMFYSLEAHRKINKLLDDFQPEIAHIHNIYHQLDPTILFAIKKRGIPIVMTVHDYKLISPNHSLFLHGAPYVRCKEGKFYQCFLDKCVKESYAKSFLAAAEMYWHAAWGTYRKNIDQYIAPSQYVKKTLIEWGIEESKIVVIPHFTSSHDTKHIETVMASERYAFYAGKISKEKGTDVLIDIMEKIPNMSLYLAGEIESGFEIPVSLKVKYLGILMKKQLEAYVQGAACVTSGSRLPETFGLVALEAIAQGKPFVGFDSGAFGEIITNGENGFLARSEAQFALYMLKIAKNDPVFDAEKIRKNAQEKYGDMGYVERLGDTFEKLRDGLTKT